MARIKKELIRLNKLIASSGKYSRREADRLIQNGFVLVNGVVITNPAEKFSINDHVVVNGEKLDFNKKVYIKFYKPIKVLTSYDKYRDKKSLLDIEFFKKNRLGYSGRLDYESEGLIIFTNDGDLIYKIQHPSSRIEKEYIVAVDKILEEKELELIRAGLKTKEIKYLPCKINYLGNYTYNIVLYEGKKREIRNIFKFFKINVKKLKRVRIGPIRIVDLKPGEYKHLSKKEIEELKKCIG
ncbi:ribosomal small subunit pseudouridine synthase A [Deferribacter desulfuricans SSM1]|uniref:Pseudouridine synthase n=1 Tax=Deferribacter desulfuricans (strain DSM 14783 / JCM 11476 / NBRC 101012 / SSM1) TaxID=639282 RepID=D3PD03_DEFDS|nr:pseudouridine synthase [Deferribacter desulfuricans]BAI80476.1 ribosomal small subunit pseudouridine synthase A [Deferribacter desulfuricans SSM1]